MLDTVDPVVACECTFRAQENVCIHLWVARKSLGDTSMAPQLRLAWLFDHLTSVLFACPVAVLWGRRVIAIIVPMIDQEAWTVAAHTDPTKALVQA